LINEQNINIYGTPGQVNVSDGSSWWMLLCTWEMK